MKRLVVVGNGMAGMACVEQILKYEPQFRITVFGDETHVNYNRVMLSSVLAGEKASDEIVIHTEEWYRRNEIDLRVGIRIVDVDARAKTVTGDDGSVTPYDTLLIATGSSAWLPPIEGLDKDGVFAFRTLDDTRELMRRSGPETRSRGDWRRPARPRSRAWVAGARLPSDGRASDGHAHGAPAR